LISLQLEEELPVSFIESIKQEKLSGFEIVRPLRRGQFSFQVDVEKPAQAAVTRDEQDGWRYETKDSSKVVQLRRTGLVYSILRGYTRWDEIKASTQEAWHSYCKWAGSLTVTKLAVRYVNVLELHFGQDCDDYLTSGPRIPPELPQEFTGFFQRVVIPFRDHQAIAIVTQALEPPNPSHVPLVLDIDVQSQQRFEETSLDIWSRLDQLREIKNMIFFSSMTKRALESYQ
jgi:uncharacterized protein (TIGR04255 family)